MITLQQITENLQDGLNQALSEAQESGNWPQTRENYQFNIIADTGNYKKHTRSGNTVTLYINGVVSIVDSDISNTQSGKISATIDTETIIAVPVIPGLNDSNGIQMVTAIRDVLNTYFSQNTYGTMSDANGIMFNYGLSFSLGSSGVREQIPWAGDVFTFYVSADYYFTQSGVNSRSVTLTIDNVPVDYINLGYGRQSDNESNVPEDSENGAATNMTTGTVFTVNFDGPVMTDALQPILSAYQFNGDRSVHTVTLSIPTYNAQSGEIAPVLYTYHMIFRDIKHNAQTISPVTMSVMMVEAATENSLSEQE